MRCGGGTLAKEKNVLYFDIETHSVDLRWDMTPEEFFRLGQYAWNDDDVVLTTDINEMIEQIEKADICVAHNGINFDLSVLYGKDSIRPLELAMEKRVLDTMVMANLVYPSKYMFKMRPGVKADGSPSQRVVYDGLKPEKVKMWLSLDNLSYQLGLDGKIADLKNLAGAYALEAGLKKTDPAGFGLIPVDDPEFMEYAVQDVVALRDLTKALKYIQRKSGVSWSYLWREMKIASIDAQISRNGMQVDLDYAQSRVDQLAQERDELMTMLVETYNFPTEGKAPWASAAGKEAIIRILAEYGITEESRPDWPRTPKGALKLGGEDLIELTRGTEAESLGRALAMLKGQRSTAQLIIDSTHADGRIHPDITRFQRSGRTSVQNPGLTVISARGEGAVDKQCILASPGRKLYSQDLSNADARIVAALSGDTEYAKRFEEGVDSHELTGRIVYGDELYDSDPKFYRNQAKAQTHSWSYRGGYKTIAKSAGVSEKDAKNFVTQMNHAYPGVLSWQEAVTEEGESGRVMNEWGRVMVVDRDRSFTQSPALHGQSGTREILCDGLIRVAEEDPEYIRWVGATIHDEIIWDVPEDEIWWFESWAREMIETTFHPEGGQPIEFPTGLGEPSSNWMEATH